MSDTADTVAMRLARIAGKDLHKERHYYELRDHEQFERAQQALLDMGVRDLVADLEMIANVSNHIAQARKIAKRRLAALLGDTNDGS